MVLRKLLIVIVVFFVGGCATGGLMSAGNIANSMAGVEGAKNKNPLIEAEIDITLANELAAIVKLNQVMLERMPVSYEDSWPEILNSYYHTIYLTQEEKRNRTKYNNCLKKLLKKDFSFYRVYNLDLYAASIMSMSKGNIFFNALGAMGSRMFIKGCENLGIEFEHAKSVLSYVPFGCDCHYFKKEFNDASYGSRICKKIKYSIYYKKKCDFFNRPTEFMLTRYLYRRGGVKNWADLPIEQCCFRAVKGEQLGTFKEVFYSLLPPSIRFKIQRIDEEAMIVKADLETVNAKLQDKSLSGAEKAALKRQKSDLMRRLKAKETLQEKLYKQALSTLNVSRENVKKAKKLKEIVDYIDRSFVENMSVIVNLTVKIINDAATMKKMNLTRAFVTYPFLVKKGVFLKRNRKFYERRYKNIVKQLIALPVTYFEIVGYTIAQEYQVSKYRSYLKAMIDMEKKLKQ
ncbi:hypothetical protein JCM12298_22850 [Desulfothermus naphthae]